MWEIEGLRAVAAWSIVVFHVWVFTSPAELQWNLGPLSAFIAPLQSGVTLFFVLSGFLLYRPIAGALLDGTKGPAVATYLRNRALRIFPAYWVVLVIAAVVMRSASLGLSAHGVAGGELTDAKTFTLDLFLVQTYLPHALWSGILPAWSLTIEVAFYAALPLLGFIGLRLAHGPACTPRRVRAAMVPVLVLLILGGLGKILVGVLTGGSSSTPSWAGVLDGSLLTHADLFALGMGAALLLLCWERRLAEGWRALLRRELSRPLAYIGLPTIFLGYYFLPRYVYTTAVAALLALVLVRLLADVDRASPSRGRAFLTHRWTLAAGGRSYSVFLWNYPLLAFLSAHHLLAAGNSAASFAVNLAIAIPLVAFLAALTYRFVEMPALRLKHKPREATSAPPAMMPVKVSS
jgi:peptidoglycan/LPS O-acetylase OafA/YrhL